MLHTNFAFPVVSETKTPCFSSFIFNDTKSLSGKSLFTFESNYYPLIDLKNNDNFYELNVELPGIERKDIKVTLNNNQLTIQAEKLSVNKENNYLLSERKYGSVSRTLNLPKDVSDEIKAKYVDGVLNLVIYKDTNKSPKIIKIE